MEKIKYQRIPCDKDCYYQQQGYCALDEITYITNCKDGGCGYFSQTDPYALLDESNRL